MKIELEDEFIVNLETNVKRFNFPYKKPPEMVKHICIHYFTLIEEFQELITSILKVIEFMSSLQKDITSQVQILQNKYFKI